jgi:lipopolysaccharide export LptBFGC system permease protein LptF
MYNKNTYLVKKIRRYATIKKSTIVICFVALAGGVFTFLFYGFLTGEKAMRFIANQNYEKMEKIMTNPRIKFEYSDNEFYNIKANKALYKNDENILLYDVDAKGDMGNIKAGELLITNDGNDLYFSGNPVLVIKQIEK